MSICSSTLSMTNRTLNRWLTSFTPSARNPVAISSSSRSALGSAGSRSPAICSRTKLVVRLVGVEGVDDVVAVAPGVRIRHIARRPGRFAVAGHVEPVAAPALAEARRRQQPIDDLLKRPVGTRRLRKASISSGVGGRPVRSKVDPAEERELVRVADRPEPLVFQLGQEEAIDVVARPGLVAHGGRLASRERLPGPVFLP